MAAVVRIAASPRVGHGSAAPAARMATARTPVIAHATHNRATRRAGPVRGGQTSAASGVVGCAIRREGWESSDSYAGRGQLSPHEPAAQEEPPQEEPPQEEPPQEEPPQEEPPQEEPPQEEPPREEPPEEEPPEDAPPQDGTPQAVPAVTTMAADTTRTEAAR